MVIPQDRRISRPAMKPIAMAPISACAGCDFTKLLTSSAIAAEPLTITNFNTYVNVHFVTTPAKSFTLQGAWVYPSNVVRLTYTNLLWTNLTFAPATGMAQHLWYNDYSITNKVTNRFRIYRGKVT